MISIFGIVLFIAIIFYFVLKIKLMYDIVDYLNELNNAINNLYDTAIDTKKQLISLEWIITSIKEKNNEPIEKENINRKRKSVAKVDYNTPLKTYKEYEQYKDKHSGLYEPRRPSRGLKIKEREVE